MRTYTLFLTTAIFIVQEIYILSSSNFTTININIPSTLQSNYDVNYTNTNWGSGYY